MVIYIKSLSQSIFECKYCAIFKINSVYWKIRQLASTTPGLSGEALAKTDRLPA
jgi:hypothetical protein